MREQRVLTIARPGSTLVLRDERVGLNRYELMAHVFVDGDKSVAFAKGSIALCEIRGFFRDGSGSLWFGEACGSCRAAFDVSLGDITRIVEVFGVRDDIVERELKARAAA